MRIDEPPDCLQANDHYDAVKHFLQGQITRDLHFVYVVFYNSPLESNEAEIVRVVL
jgi:hypothetical protein